MSNFGCRITCELDVKLDVEEDAKSDAKSDAKFNSADSVVFENRLEMRFGNSKNRS